MQKMIKLSDTHYIIMDDSEVWPNNWVYSYVTKSIVQFTDPRHFSEGTYKKITHSTQPLDYDIDGGYYPMSVTALSLSEVEEAIYGFSVEKMALEYRNKQGKAIQVSREAGYIAGFKAHQELVKDKLFTEIDKQIADFKHDLRESTSTYVKQNCEGALFGLKRLKQSLLPKTEWDIEFDEQGKIKLI